MHTAGNQLEKSAGMYTGARGGFAGLVGNTATGDDNSLK